MNLIFLLLTIASYWIKSETKQIISINQNEPDDIVKILPDDEKINEICEENYYWTLDMSKMGIKNLAANNFNNPQNIRCLNLEGNEIRNLPNDLFDVQHLSNLSYLNLTNNNLDINNLKFLNGHKNLKTLILDGNSKRILRFIPSILLPNLENLYLRNNHLYNKISYNDLLKNFPRLKKLFLTNNNDVYIDDYNRNINSNLTHIFIEKNRVSNFQYLLNIPSLTHLYFDDNTRNSFCLDYSNIKVLSLKNCKLTKLNLCDTLSSLNNLITLDLSQNQMTTLSVEQSNIFSFLQNLSLSYNFITEIPRNINNLQLKILSLSYNNITEIKERAFENSKNLQILSLRGNKISHLDVNSLAGLANLEILDLAKNHFTNLPFNWADKFFNLHYLNVNFNNFSSFTQLSLQNNIGLKNLHLRNNNISEIIMESLINLPSQLIIHVSPICSKKF